MSKTTTVTLNPPSAVARRTRTSHAVLLALLLAGCSVQPKAFDANENQARSADLVVRANADQEPVTGPIDLYEAMARAIKYNLDGRVELMNLALAQRELDLSRYDMLPKLVATVDYGGRDNYSGASASRCSPARPRWSHRRLRRRTLSRATSPSVGTFWTSACRMCAPSRRRTA